MQSVFQLKIKRWLDMIMISKNVVIVKQTQVLKTTNCMKYDKPLKLYIA